MKRVHFIRQEAVNECGIACISMVEGYYGFLQPLSYYRNILHIGRDGASIKDIYMIMTSDKLSVQVLKIEDFLQFPFEKKPYIVHFQKSHYVVIEKAKSDMLKVYDPSSGISLLSRESLQQMSSGYCILAAPSSEFIRLNNRKNDFRHFIPVIKKLSFLLSVIFILSLFAYGVTLIHPLLLQYFINESYYSGTFTISHGIFTISLLAVSFWLLSTLRNKLMVKLQSKLYRSISFSTIQRLFSVGYSYFDNRSEGDVLYRLQFLTQFQNAISGTFLQLIVAITNMLVVLIYLGYAYPKLTLLVTPLLIIFLVAVLLMNNHLLELKKNELQSSKKMEQTVTEIVSNMLQIRCLHLEPNFWTAYKNYFEQFIAKFDTTQTVTQRYSLIINVIFTFLPPSLVIVIMGVYNKGMEIGALFAIFSFLTTLFSQCMGMVSNISSLQLLKASISYLNDFLDEPESKKEEQHLNSAFTSLDARELSFRYSDTGKFVLRNVSFSVNKGENVAIVGVSGSGKTTLVKLIAGLYAPTSGLLTINGIPIYELHRTTFGEMIAIVPQLPVVFNKSIRENVVLDRESVSDDCVIRALKLACLWDDVSSMPQKLDTVLSGQGGNLSGGQIQRLSIARAILRSPQLLILDEATSSLDAHNENAILNNIREDGITSIIISHRLTTVEHANTIIVIDKGQIVGVGSHSYLMNNCLQYRNLYLAQTNLDK